MPKIKVEIEVPNGKYCLECKYGKYVASDFAMCTLFGDIIQRTEDIFPKRCDKCKQAEVENENQN